MDITGAIARAQEVNKKLLGLGVKRGENLSFHPLYDLSTDMAEHISYHAVKGVFPEKLFAHRSPNQTEEEFKYIKNNYKQFTLPVFVDLISTVSRIFADNNWHIEYKGETVGEDFKKYVENEVPIYGSVENYVKFILTPNKLIDANGFIAIRPKELPIIEQDGETFIDPNTKYQPYPVFFPSKNVIDYKDGEYYLFLSAEKSNVTSHNKVEKTGSVFELYTKDRCYFIRQTGKKSDNTFEFQEWIEYKSIPVMQLRGLPMLIGESVLWQSQFIYAVDLLDTVLTNENWLQAAMNKCVYPHTVMYGSPCEFRDPEGHICSDGYLFIDGHQKTCPSCNGSGLKSRLSPLGTLLLKPKGLTENGDSGMTHDPLKFVSPDVHTLEFIREKVDRDEARARKILHLHTSNSNVKGTEDMTATGMAIDAKSMFAFIKPISDQIFSLYEFILNTIGEQRYSEGFEKPTLHYPKTFDFKTPEDYLQEISEATANNLPPSFVQYVLMKYIDSIYGDSEKTIKIFSIIVAADRLFGVSQDEINLKLARGTVAKWEDILHTSAVNFISELIGKKPGFLDLSIEKQVDALRKMSIEKEKAMSSTLVDGIYSQTGGTGNALKESVGGLTGMIEIAKAVGSGLMDLEAAVAIVQDRFGLSYEEAKRQIGTPQIISSPAEADTVAKLT